MRCGWSSGCSGIGQGLPWWVIPRSILLLLSQVIGEALRPLDGLVNSDGGCGRREGVEHPPGHECRPHEEKGGDDETAHHRGHVSRTRRGSWQLRSWGSHPIFKAPLVILLVG